MGSAARWPARKVRLRATEIPLSRITDLKRSLSMQSADAATPAPTYATSTSSRRPCTVPSSPKGPWSTGKTTSISLSGSTLPFSGSGTGSPAWAPSSSGDAGCSCHRPSAPISISRTS